MKSVVTIESSGYFEPTRITRNLNKLDRDYLDTFRKIAKLRRNYSKRSECSQEFYELLELYKSQIFNRRLVFSKDYEANLSDPKLETLLDAEDQFLKTEFSRHGLSEPKIHINDDDICVFVDGIRSLGVGIIQQAIEDLKYSRDKCDDYQKKYATMIKADARIFLSYDIEGIVIKYNLDLDAFKVMDTYRTRFGFHGLSREQAIERLKKVVK